MPLCFLNFIHALNVLVIFHFLKKSHSSIHQFLDSYTHIYAFVGFKGISCDIILTTSCVLFKKLLILFRQ